MCTWHRSNRNYTVCTVLNQRCMCTVLSQRPVVFLTSGLRSVNAVQIVYSADSLVYSNIGTLCTQHFWLSGVSCRCTVLVHVAVNIQSLWRSAFGRQHVCAVVICSSHWSIVWSWTLPCILSYRRYATVHVVLLNATNCCLV